jgi:hypothetical protein
MILLENLPLGLVMIGGAYAWYRAGFRVPRALGVSPHTIRRLGWLMVIGITVKSVGSQFGNGRVAIANSGRMYAYRSHEPLLFWGEIAGELALVGGTGIVFILLARRSARNESLPRDA